MKISKTRAAQIAAAERRYQQSQQGCTITSIRSPRYTVRDNATGATHEVVNHQGLHTCTCGKIACKHVAEVEKLERRLDTPAPKPTPATPWHYTDDKAFSMFK